MRRWGVALVLAGCAWAISATAYFLTPGDQRLPHRADAVVVLAGDDDARVPVGIRLVADGLAPLLALSREGGAGWLGRRYCEGRTSLRALCFRADPYSTRGEARSVAELARRRGWSSIVVVTSGYHVRRARLLFRRCLGDVHVAFRGAPYAGRWIPVDLAFESVKLARAGIQRGC